MIIRPIWQDTILNVDAEVFEYSIRTNEGVIYRGRAYKRPNAEYNTIKINKIVEAYLHNDISEMLDVLKDNPTGIEGYSEDGFKIFEVWDEKENVIKATYGFLYDWSYDSTIWDLWTGTDMSLSHPINGRYAAGMYSLNSKLYLTYYGETVNRVLNNITPAIPNINNPCNAEYALYYLNSYGGWDSFLFEGAVYKEDKITQYTTDKTYNNTSVDFETYRHVSEIQTNYTCNTGWLTDEQAANFAKNVISTNLCYLHKLKEDTIIPVLIDEMQAKYQKYSTNGNMMAQYEIKIKESHTRIRR